MSAELRDVKFIRPPDFLQDVARPLRSFHSRYIESEAFKRAKKEIAKLNRQYDVRAMIEIIFDTAKYQNSEEENRLRSVPQDCALPFEIVDGKLWFAALAIVYRSTPDPKNKKQFDPVDITIHNTFNHRLSPHAALYFLDMANERDIEFMKSRLNDDRVAKSHDQQPVLTPDQRQALLIDLEERMKMRLKLRARANALRENP